MRESVKTPFFEYSVKHEGFTPFMYCDTLNLVTTGIGNLIDFGPRNSHEVTPQAMAPAMGLPWKRKGSGWTTKNPVAGGALSQSEIAAAWATTKKLDEESPGAAMKGGFTTYPGLTDATLDMDGIRVLFNRTLGSNENTLRKNYPNYDSAPADAQMAISSMAWACGAAFFPALRPHPNLPPGPGNVPFFQRFHDAFVSGDFTTCVDACQFKGGGSVTDPRSRNHDNAIMFQNAANVVKAGGDLDLLFFPRTSNSPAAVTPSGGVNPAIGLINKPASVGEVAVGGALAVGASWGLYKFGKSRGWF